SSRSPACIARREIPVTRATAAIPPYPSDLASVAAHNRRSRSLRSGTRSEKRCRITVSMLSRRIDTLYLIQLQVVTVIYGHFLSRGLWVVHRRLCYTRLARGRGA